MPIEIVTLALQAYIESIKLITLVIQDQPVAERQKAWERWFRFWESIEKGLGLDKNDKPGA